MLTHSPPASLIFSDPELQSAHVVTTILEKGQPLQLIFFLRFTMAPSIKIDKASFYFRDPAYEAPQRRRLFPFVSAAATIDASSPCKGNEFTLPRELHQGRGFASLSSMYFCTDRYPPSSIRGSKPNPTKFWGDFVPDDDSSCGSLGYSLDLDNKSSAGYAANCIQEDAMDFFDVHSSDRKEINDCFKLPWEWVVSCFANLRK
jgi:hypothetical protein